MDVRSGSISEWVRAFVARQTGMRVQDFRMETTLGWDLGMAGEDATDFFEAFAREFGIDADSLPTIDFDRYYGPEAITVGGCCFMLFVVGVLLWLVVYDAVPLWLGLIVCVLSVYAISKAKLQLHKRDMKAIRVKDLVEAAEAKRWLTQG